MSDAQQTLDRFFLEMRWRCLSLAADLDRVQRGEKGAAVLAKDPRMAKLRTAISVLLEGEGNRAERVQMVFSDLTAPPK
jgi:hypothetical protein